LKRMMVGIVLALVSIVAAAEAPRTGKAGTGEASSCVVRSGPKGLDVRCPNASVAQLLAAFKRATGLRSEYPDQLAATRVSVSLRRVQLHDALRSALTAFNIAIWEDQNSPSVTWVRLVGLRRPSDGVQQARTEEQPTVSSYPEAAPIAETIPVQTASLFPQPDLAEMAKVRQAFANSVTLGSPLVPPPGAGAANGAASESRSAPAARANVPATR
jgi:hypothetical protein